MIGENKDDVIGILLAKELLNYYANPDSFNLRETLRPAVFVPESKRLNVLLRDFRANRNHIAIVVDEYGGVSGLVTIEDVLEQIVGDIEDEYDFDESEDNIIPEASGRFRVKAQTEIDDFNAQFGTTFANDEFDTVGGLVLQAFGRLPKRGEATTSAASVSGCCAPTAAGCIRCRSNGSRRRQATTRLHHRPTRPMTLARGLPLLLAAAAGAGTVFAFAPFAVSGVAFVTLAVLFGLGSAPIRRASGAMLGFAFGVGLFGAGASWLYIALENFGGMPPWLALIAIAVLPRLSRALARRSRLSCSASARRRSRSRGSLIAAGAFTLAEWIRGCLFTGFPWLSLGLFASPRRTRAGYAPLGGVYLVTLVMALFAALLAHLIEALARDARRALALTASGIAALASDRRRAVAHRMDAARRASRCPCRCCRATSRRTSSSTRSFARTPSTATCASSQRSRGRLVVLPESAFPMFSDEVPDAVLLSLIRSGERPRRRRAARALHRRAAASRAATSRATTIASCARRQRPAVLPQASPGALRRDDSAQTGLRLVRCARCSPSRSPTRRAAAPTQPRRSTVAGHASR